MCIPITDSVLNVQGGMLGKAPQAVPKQGWNYGHIVSQISKQLTLTLTHLHSLVLCLHTHSSTTSVEKHSLQMHVGKEKRGKEREMERGGREGWREGGREGGKTWREGGWKEGRQGERAKEKG